MLHQNRNKQYTGLRGGFKMDVFNNLVVIKDCSSVFVMSMGFLEQLDKIF